MIAILWLLKSFLSYVNLDPLNRALFKHQICTKRLSTDYPWWIFKLMNGIFGCCLTLIGCDFAEVWASNLETVYFQVQPSTWADETLSSDVFGPVSLSPLALREQRSVFKILRVICILVVVSNLFGSMVHLGLYQESLELLLRFADVLSAPQVAEVKLLQLI